MLSLCPYNAIQGAAVDQDRVADEPALLSRLVTESLFPDLTPEKGKLALVKDLVVDKEISLQPQNGGNIDDTKEATRFL